MNSRKENEENEKLFHIKQSLKNTSETNIQKILSFRENLEIINGKILFYKRQANFYETKLDELLTQIANIEWNQVKAKTVLKVDIQYVEEFKNKITGNEQNINKIVEDNSVINKTLELKKLKETLETQCKINDNTIQELYNEFQKMKEDC